MSEDTYPFYLLTKPTFKHMKLKLLPLIGFLLGLLLAVVALLGLFGNSESISILYWLRDKIALVILFTLGCLIVYYLSPFVIDFTDKE